jgi:hypothetical protein
LTGDSLPATFCLVYVKFMLENLHIILCQYSLITTGAQNDKKS